MNHWLAIACGGALGAMLRYAVSKAEWVQNLGSSHFPTGTLIVNVVGSFALGLLIVLLVQKYTTVEWLRLFLFVGVLGAFTTFSTFSVETVNLFMAGKHATALWNMSLNLFASVAAAALGLYLGKTLV